MRPTADDDPLAIVDQVRLRRLSDAQAALRQHGADHRLDAALAVGPTDEDAADAGLGGSERPEQGTRATETESNAEPAPILERGDDLVDAVLADSHVSRHAVNDASGRPRRRRTG